VLALLLALEDPIRSNVYAFFSLESPSDLSVRHLAYLALLGATLRYLHIVSRLLYVIYRSQYRADCRRLPGWRTKQLLDNYRGILGCAIEGELKTRCHQLPFFSRCNRYARYLVAAELRPLTRDARKKRRVELELRIRTGLS